MSKEDVELEERKRYRMSCPYYFSNYCMLGGRYEHLKCVRKVSGACARMTKYDLEHPRRYSLK